MEQLEIEQTEHNTQTAVAEEELGEGKRELSFKKFKDATSLQKAYSSLESEFTKRSQKIKELEGEKQKLLEELEKGAKALPKISDTSVSGKEQTEDFYNKYPSARSYIKEITDLAVKKGEYGSQGFLDRAYIELLEGKVRQLSDNIESQDFLMSHIEGTAIKDEIIKKYLLDIKNSKPKIKLISDGGEISLAPSIRPKTLEEAGLLAKSLLKK